VHLLRGESALARAHCAAAIDLASRHDLPYILAMAMMLDGWAAAESDVALGRRLLDDGFAVCQLMGPRVGEVEYSAILARIETTTGDVPSGLARVAEALKIARERSEHYLESNLLCMRGQLLLRAAIRDGGGASQAAVALRESIDVARRQGCRAFELRAALALARLREHEGRANEALDVLAPVFDAFSEGFDVSDLAEAGALLARLRFDRRSRVDTRGRSRR
jgi:hypothetical protein